jgi:hypothetical protein
MNWTKRNSFKVPEFHRIDDCNAKLKARRWRISGLEAECPIIFQEIQSESLNR